MRRALVGACIIATTWLAACGEEAKPPAPELGPACGGRTATELCEQGDPFACRWGGLLASRVDETSVAPLLGLNETAGREAIVRALFPLDGVDLEPDLPAPPPEVTITVRRGLAPVTASFPLDWTMDPLRDPTWRLFFSALHWLPDVPPAAGGQALVEWSDVVLGTTDPDLLVWYDHAMAVRVDAVSRFVDRYLEAPGPHSLDVLWAATRVVVTHLYALATEGCYRPAHNHGVMEDRAILRVVNRSPIFVDEPALRDLVRTRLLAQVEGAVSSEGLHLENSPLYHWFFLKLIDDLILLMDQGGDAAPASLVEVRERMAAEMVHLLQPNLTAPQFGDTENDVLGDEILRFVDHVGARGQDEAGLDQLAWVASGGQRGVAPPAVDRVWPLSGFAAFRSDWGAHDHGISGHFTCGKLSPVHYHEDETSIAIYGYGQELIVDPGLHSYKTDALSLHAKSVLAHNVLAVDGYDHAASGEVYIDAHGGVGTSLPWVRGGHGHFASQGVDRLERTFAHRKPDVFLVIDHLEAPGSHELRQSFLLHPSLSRVEWLDARTVRASREDGLGPSVVLTALAPATGTHSVDVDAEEGTGAWFFPAWLEAVATTRIAFTTPFEGGRVHLPVAIHVVAPGEAADVRLRSLTAASGTLELTWEGITGPASATLPSPW